MLFSSVALPVDVDIAAPKFDFDRAQLNSTAASAFPDGPPPASVRFGAVAGEFAFSAAELHASVRVAAFAARDAAPSVVFGPHWPSSEPPADALFLAAAAAFGVPGFVFQPAFPVAVDISCQLPRCRWLGPCICEPGLR